MWALIILSATIYIHRGSNRNSIFSPLSVLAVVTYQVTFYIMIMFYPFFSIFIQNSILLRIINGMDMDWTLPMLFHLNVFKYQKLQIQLGRVLKLHLKLTSNLIKVSQRHRRIFFICIYVCNAYMILIQMFDKLLWKPSHMGFIYLT